MTFAYSYRTLYGWVKISSSGRVWLRSRLPPAYVGTLLLLFFTSTLDSVVRKKFKLCKPPKPWPACPQRPIRAQGFETSFEDVNDDLVPYDRVDQQLKDAKRWCVPEWSQNHIFHRYGR